MLSQIYLFIYLFIYSVENKSRNFKDSVHAFRMNMDYICQP